MKKTFKRYEYWSKEGKKWTDWFEWNSDYKPALQMDDRRIISRLKNEYREEN
ncbi:MAG: hypothetical protein IJ743_03225 [Bacilli bacterium]|nr:hypothetical protein [Bacilli bacterium]